MKRIKNIFFKIAILLIVIGSMAILYWLYSAKRFDNKSIPKDADAVAIVDIKNIRNHFIFSYLKNPSQWRFGFNNSENGKHFELSNYGIETTDYLSFFHIQKQPIDQWFFVAQIENESKFNKGLINFKFVKTKHDSPFISYYSKTIDSYIIQFKNQILYCVNGSKNKLVCMQIAKGLFINHNYLDSKKTENLVQTSNAVTLWIQKNNLLKEDGIIKINLKDDEIIAKGQLNWKSKYRKTFNYIQNPNALLSLGFNFDMILDQNAFKNYSSSINKMIGFDLDSILIHHPTKTELVFNSIIEKKDSAITYDYDDDFNPIKKVVLHTNREPSFYFMIQTDDSKKIYDYLKTQNLIDEHQIFLNFPLAKTKIHVQNHSLILKGNVFKSSSSKLSASKIGYLQLNLNQIKAKDWLFLIAKNKYLAGLKPFGILEINLTGKNNLGYFEASLKTKDKKDLLEMMK